MENQKEEHANYVLMDVQHAVDLNWINAQFVRMDSTLSTKILAMSDVMPDTS
jgi:hypothetical protein